MLRQLIVNADDFGFTRGVNEGILRAHREGIVTATTLMANGPAFEHAVELARENPALDVGCHLVLVGGQSLAAPGRALPESVRALATAVLLRRIPIYDELAAQVRKLIDAGIHPTHVDTHKHTHLLPQVLNAVLRVAREFRIPWIRRTLVVPVVRRRFDRLIRSNGCHAAGHLAGFQLTGRFGIEDLVRLIHALPPGLTEFLCHPGYSDDDLRRSPTRLVKSREREVAALTAPEVREALRAAGVELVSFRDLTATTSDNSGPTSPR